MEKKSQETLEAGEPQASSRTERRRRVRMPVHWQVCFVSPDLRNTVEMTTRDLSSIGFHCLSPVPLATGERVICVLKAPSYGPQGGERGVHLECRVRIVRVEPANESGSYGIAGEIEDYQFLDSKRMDTNCDEPVVSKLAS